MKPSRRFAWIAIFIVDAGFVAWGAMAAAYQPTLHRFRRSVLWAPCLPVVAAFYLAATIGAAVNHHLGRGVAWRGRAYQGAGA